MNKLSNKLIATLLVFCLLIAQYSIFAINIAEAVEETLEAATITKNSNIEFNAYFMGSTNVTTRTPVLDTQEIQHLYLELNVKDQVSLVDGKIKLENPNFTIKEDELKESDYVKNVNAETNEIELKKIYSNTTAIIELPVQFKTQDKIGTNYFDKEIEFSLSGKYENSKQKQKDLEGKVLVKPTWKTEAEINLSQTVEKFFNLGDNGTLLQQKITTEVANNVLPRNNERIEAMVPTLGEQKPSEVIVLINGERQNNSNVSYDSGLGILTIVNQNIEDGEGNVAWGTDKVDYTLIYKYNNKVEETETPVSLRTKSTTSLYTKENEDVKELNQDAVITPVGSIATVSTSLYGEIYKGYLYHNEANEIEYKEKNDIEISYIDESIEKLELQTNTSAFLNEAGAKVADSTSVTYKQTQFQKQELFNILGNDGKVTIKRANGEVISEVTNDIQTDDNGIITVSYNNPETSIIIETTRPQVEGRITVLNTKELSGQTNQNVNALKLAKYFAAASELTTNLSKETNTATIELKEPTTEAKLTMDKTDLSTLNTNNVKIVATLISNDEKHELFRNPRLQIRLPEQVQSINVNSINKLYADELQFGSTSLVGNVINIELVGEQASHLGDVCEGIQVVVDCDIAFDKTIPSTSSKVELAYTNENSGNIEQIASQDVRVSSKYGAMLYSKIDSINKENESIETFTGETVEGELDTKSPAKQANAFTEVVNNYEDAMNNVEVVINLPNKEVSVEKSTIDLQLLDNVVAQKENTQILYATEDVDANSSKWQEQVTNLQDVKKVKLVTEELKPGESLPLTYVMAIPENLQGSEVAYQATSLNYEYQGKAYQTSSNLKLTANEDITQGEVQGSTVTQNVGGIQIQAQASSVGKEVQAGSSVLEGQTITYNVTVRNNTGRDLNNLVLEAKQTDSEGNSNVTYYGTTSRDELQPITGEMETVYYYREDESLNSKKMQKETLATGETATFKYEFSINEDVKENEITKGILTVSADELENQQLELMENKIEQAEVKTKAFYVHNEEVEFETRIKTLFGYSIKNLTDNTMNDVTLKIVIPKGITISDSEANEIEGAEVVKKTNDMLELKVREIKAGETYTADLYVSADDLPYEETQRNYDFYCVASQNGKSYYSNKVTKSVIQNKVPLEMSQTSDLNSSIAKKDDVITYTTTITNKGNVDKEFLIEDVLPKILNMEEAYITSNGERVATLEKQNQNISYSAAYNLKAGETIQVVERTKVGSNDDAVDSFTHYITASTADQSEGKDTAITYKVEVKIYNSNIVSGQRPSNSGQSGNTGGSQSGEQGSTGTGSTGNGIGETGTGSISGQAWLDTNKDGIKTESGFAGIQVLLINASTGAISRQTSTSGTGAYSFQGLADGNYIVGFRYDTTKYSSTQYRANGSNDDNNCDVVTREVNIGGQTQRLATSDEIQISGNSVTNVDAGFTENSIFDLSLKKGVRKIMVQTSKETKEYDQKDADLAKIELHRKDIQGATVLVEYVIKVTNEGETPGYAGDIVDYLPKELTFSSEINKDWYTMEGKIHNQSLANTIINPGETKEITLTLAKTMTENNAGAIQNIAEIEKAANDLGQSDRDSTPGNNKDGEDDKATADVIISIGTGAMGYTAIVLAVLLGLGFVGVAIYNIMDTNKNEEDEEEEGV